MTENAVSSFPWNEIEVSNLILPSELTVFYLYKYRKDATSKKNNKASEDLSYIKNYQEKMWGEDYVRKSN